MKQVYVRNDNELTVVSVPDANHTSNNIPAGTYRLNVSKNENETEKFISLSILEKFKLPEKVYGDCKLKSQRVKEAYKSRKGNLGVILHGQSGSGKSLLAKMICLDFLEELKLPIIVVGKDSIQEIETFVDKLKQPVVFFLDEFEKMFDYSDQQGYLLSVMDGVYQSKHLFLLTANRAHEINEYFFNRPSRIRYNWHYKAVPSEVVRQIIDDKVDDVDRANKIHSVLMQLGEVSYDSINSFIEECLIFQNIEPDELIKGFNIEVSGGGLNDNYSVNITIEGKTLSEWMVDLFGVQCDFMISLRNQISINDLYRYGANMEYGQVQFIFEGDRRINNTFVVKGCKETNVSFDKFDTTIELDQSMVNNMVSRLFDTIPQVIYQKENKDKKDEGNGPLGMFGRPTVQSDPTTYAKLKELFAKPIKLVGTKYNQQSTSFNTATTRTRSPASRGGFFF